MISGENRAELVAYLVRRSSDHVLSEDIAQDAIARLIGHMQKVPVSNPRALLFRIADNLLVSDWRRRRVRNSEPLTEVIADERPGNEQLLIDRDQLAHIRAIIAEMPPLRREVLVRRRLRGESHAEIGRAMGLSPAAVEKHLTRALVTLRTRMSAIENAPGDAAGSAS